MGIFEKMWILDQKHLEIAILSDNFFIDQPVFSQKCQFLTVLHLNQILVKIDPFQTIYDDFYLKNDHFSSKLIIFDHDRNPPFSVMKPCAFEPILRLHAP